MFRYEKSCSWKTDQYHWSLPVKLFDPIWDEYDQRPDEDRNIAYWDWVHMTYGIVVGPSFRAYEGWDRFYPIAFQDMDKVEVFVKKFSLAKWMTILPSEK